MDLSHQDVRFPEKESGTCYAAVIVLDEFESTFCEACQRAVDRIKAAGAKEVGVVISIAHMW